MCDTCVVLSDSSTVNATILGKNSDRPSFDCQPLAYHRKKTFLKAEKLELAYVVIEQVKERNATIGTSPYWCWGYEAGMNEHGVAIGNEAIYTKDLNENAKSEEQGIKVEKGILGMELLRLGLERGKTAEEALKVMTELIEKYGQWGSGVPMEDTAAGSYNNGFIIADRKEAYILEAAGKQWAARKLEKGCAAISNEVSIRKDRTLGSKELVQYAAAKGWCSPKEEDFDFAAAYIDRKKPRQVSHIRVQRIRQLLRQALESKEKVSPEWIKRILRDHYEDTFLEGPYFNPSDPDFLTICMHQSKGNFTWGNTASSTLSILANNDRSLNVMWWAPVVPCCSVYIPIFLESNGIPKCLEKAGTYGKTFCPPSEVTAQDTYEEGSFWWEMRSLLDIVNGDDIGSSYEERHGIVRKVFDQLEEKWFSEISGIEKEAILLRDCGKKAEMAELLYNFTETCTMEALKCIEDLRTMFLGK